MAERRRRATRASGASPRTASTWPAESVSGAGSGSTIAATPAASPSPGPIATRATYRTLLVRGLTPDEAANLTAYLAGLPIDDTTWTLAQVNRVLFLRELARTGRFGGRDGETSTR
jgi:hypothetical protein